MGLKSIKYIELDDQIGALYSGGKQSLLVPVNFIKAIYSIFVQLVGLTGAEILISKIGESVGLGYVQSLEYLLKKEKTKLGKETKIKVSCNAIFMEAGWGRIKVKKLDLSEKILEVEIFYSPSGEFLEKSGYSLEKGILTGIYQGITGQDVYCQLLKEDKKKHSVVLITSKEIHGRLKKKEKMVLVGRKELEKKIQERTKELQMKIAELENFTQLTIGRELKMAELKEEIEQLKKTKL